MGLFFRGTSVLGLFVVPSHLFRFLAFYFGFSGGFTFNPLGKTFRGSEPTALGGDLGPPLLRWFQLEQWVFHNTWLSLGDILQFCFLWFSG